MQTLVNGLGWVPRYCVWEITRACDLRCGHCGSSAGEPRRDELTTTEALRLIDALAELGTEVITLSGGEPTLRADWVSLARHAVGLGLVTNLVTNGQVDAPRLAADARDAGLANVAVSLDGLEPTHDALRGRGTFLCATTAIRELTEACIWVDVMVTVNQRNLPELRELHALAARLGAKRFRVQLGKPIGSQTHRADLTLTPRHLLGLLPELGRLDRKQGLPVQLGDSIGYYSREERWLRGDYCKQGFFTGCYAGCQAVGIQSDGGVKGCLSLQPRAGEPDRFIEGNVRCESLKDIWLDPGRFRYNRAPIHELKGPCAKCSHASLCRGGAKCVAYAYTGGIEQNPMCYLATLHAHRKSLDRSWPVSGAAATAMLLGIGTGWGCSGQVSEPAGTGGAGGSTTSTVVGSSASGSTTATGGTQPGTAATGGQGLSAGGQSASGGTGAQSSSTINCQSVCCMCDYGIIAPDIYDACCGN